LVSCAFLVASEHYLMDPNLSDQEAFEQYNRFWNKTHSSPTDREKRFQNFLISSQRIAEANAKYPGASFGYTKFADWSREEFASLLGTTTQPKHSNNRLPQAIPQKGIDWVAKGCVTPPKNQGQCGSCWVLSAVATVESNNLVLGRPMTIGSSQEVLDCDNDGEGCNGGDPEQALDWILSQGGLVPESCYPDHHQNEPCQSDKCRVSPNLNLTAVIPVAGNELAMYNALTKGPLSITHNADNWQYYTGGVLPASGCGKDVDHSAELVGYSPEDGGYWIDFNTWEVEWGQNGCIWLQYGHDTCAITSEVVAVRA